MDRILEMVRQPAACISENRFLEYPTPKNGWLIPYPESELGPPKGLIPLMAILQENKQKVWPVMDYRELNEHVNTYTANADVCAQTMQEWRQRAKSCYSGPAPGISADSH